MNDIALLEKGMEKLLRNVFTSNSLYLLGSGVSFQYSLMLGSLIQKIASDYLSSGSFPIENDNQNLLSISLMQSYIENSNFTDIEKFFLQGIPDSFTKACIIEEYGKPHIPKNTEYQIFLLAKKGSTVVDMNYEGFAERYLTHYHYVISMHGTANSNLHEWIKKNKEDIAIYNLNIHQYSGIKVYPSEKQTRHIIEPYKKILIEHVFPTLEWLAIIGYTFGNLDDIELLQLIQEYIEYYKKVKIIIIDPKPEKIAQYFEKQLDRVIILPAYWNALSSAILNQKIHLDTNYDILRILYDYYKRSESQRTSGLI